MKVNSGVSFPPPCLNARPGPRFSGRSSQKPEGASPQKEGERTWLARTRKGLATTYRAAYIALKVAVYYCASIGGLAVITQPDTNPRLPMFNVLSESAPDVLPLLERNTTEKLVCKTELTLEEVWRHLQPTLQILKALSPEIEQWVREQYARGNIHLNANNVSSELMSLADGLWTAPVLGIGRKAFKHDDGEKALTLVHEYRHSRESDLLKIKRNMVENLRRVVLRDKTDPYANEAEEAAYAYEGQAAEAMGRDNDRNHSWRQSRNMLYQRNKYHIRDLIGQRLELMDAANQKRVEQGGPPPGPLGKATPTCKTLS